MTPTLLDRIGGPAAIRARAGLEVVRDYDFRWPGGTGSALIRAAEGDLNAAVTDYDDLISGNCKPWEVYPELAPDNDDPGQASYTAALRVALEWAAGNLAVYTIELARAVGAYQCAETETAAALPAALTRGATWHQASSRS